MSTASTTLDEVHARAGAGRSAASSRVQKDLLRPAVWAAYAVMTVLLLAYLVSLVARGEGQRWEPIDGWSVAVLELGATALCFLRAATRPQARTMTLVLAAGLLAWSLGDLVLAAESPGGVAPPVPSLADLFYIAFYPPTYIAVVMFMRGEVRRLATPSWLDGAVAGLGAAAICAAFFFRSILQSTGGDPLGVAINLAYPVGDLLLLALVVAGTTVLGGRRKAPWFLLAGGIGLNVVGDTFNLFQSSAGATRLGTVFNGIAWPAAIVMMSMSVWLRPRPSNPLAQQKPTGFVLPGLAAVAGLLILLIGTVRPPGWLAVGLAAATLAAVSVRLAISVRSLRILTAERQRQSVTDDLTGLGNRRYLFSVLDAFFAEQSAAPDRKLAFLFLDLNRFKEINDTFGHPAGDELLRQLGPRLSGLLRETDALVRLGGDEFAVLLVDAEADYAISVAERLAARLEDPFSLHGVSARIGASIGVALAPADATDSAGLLSCADVAMYRAKSGGSTFALYEQDLDSGGSRMLLVEELRAAVEAGQLTVHYQPQLDLRTGEIRAVEALLRWAHPRLGLVPPLKFLPIADEAGLMSDLTRWVLEQALTQCAIWRADGRMMSVAVNVSAPTFLEDGFGDQVWSQLARHHLPAEALVLEITETNVITEFDRCQSVIAGLRSRGLVVSIDDFGAGFTSLAYLSSLRVGELKLDRTFVSGLAGEEGQRNLELVRSTIELGHAMGLRVVAEGIEDSDTLELLTDLGCDIAQGYFIGRPRPEDQLAFRADTAAQLATAFPR